MTTLRWKDTEFNYIAYRWENRYRLSKKSLVNPREFWCGETEDCEEDIIPDISNVSWWKNSKYEPTNDSKLVYRKNGYTCVRCGKEGEVKVSKLNDAWVCKRCIETIETCPYEPHSNSVTKIGYWVFTGPPGWVWMDIYPGGFRSSKSLSQDTSLVVNQ